MFQSSSFVILALAVTMTFAQTGENFCQTGVVNITGTNSICSSGSFTLCSPYPGVAQNQANIITNNMTSITQSGQINKGNNACAYLNAVGTSAWVTPGHVCPPLPASTCTVGAACDTPTTALTPAANATLPCCSDLRYFARLWCEGPNMLNVDVEIKPNSNKISLLTYLPGLGQTMNCKLCGAELPSTTAVATTTSTTAAPTTTTTRAPTTSTAAATTGTVVAVGSTVSGGPAATTARPATTTAAAVVQTTTAAAVVQTTAAAVVATTEPTPAGTVSAAAIATTANVIATTAAMEPTQQQPSPIVQQTTGAGQIQVPSTTSASVRASASMVAVIALPLIIAALL
jgi:hypothetical protein